MTQWTATLSVNNKAATGSNGVQIKLDSGAEITVISCDFFLNLESQTKLKSTNKVLLGPSGIKWTVRKCSQFILPTISTP